MEKYVFGLKFQIGNYFVRDIENNYKKKLRYLLMPTKWRLFKQKYNEYFRRWSPKHRPTTLDKNGRHLYLPPPLKATIFNEAFLTAAFFKT